MAQAVLYTLRKTTTMTKCRGNVVTFDNDFESWENHNVWHYVQNWHADLGWLALTAAADAAGEETALMQLKQQMQQEKEMALVQQKQQMKQQVQQYMMQQQHMPLITATQTQAGSSPARLVWQSCFVAVSSKTVGGGQKPMTLESIANLKITSIGQVAVRVARQQQTILIAAHILKISLAK